MGPQPNKKSIWLAASLGLTGYSAEAANVVEPEKRWPTRAIEVVVCDDRRSPALAELCRPQRGGESNHFGLLKAAEAATIRAALAHWNSLFAHNIALKEVDDASSPSAIVFRLSSRSTRCSTRRVGYSAAEPVNFVSVGARCNRTGQSKRTAPGVVLHEIMHAVGFYHEQERSDRAKFLSIDPLRSLRVAWGLTCGRKVAECGKGRRGSIHGPYDFASIMHYSTEGKRADGSHLTEIGRGHLESFGSISGKIGQRERLSRLDIAAVRALYPAKGDLAGS